MAQVIRKMPLARTRGNTYPWSVWLDGKIRRLMVGKDFKITPDSFEVLARRQAAKRKRSLSLIREYNGADKVVSVCIQLQSDNRSRPLLAKGSKRTTSLTALRPKAPAQRRTTKVAS